VLGVAGLTLAVASLWVEALVRPIDALTRSAAALIHGDVTARHDDKGPAEVRFLARRFNQLADWLQASSAHISRLAADLDRQVHDRVREIEEANRQLAELAHTDPLTGLINRRGLEMELARYLTLARRHQHSLGVIMMDLDNFKVYNDRCGHLSGDTVLRTVADALKAKARSSDVVSRWGGDEFCILIPAVDTPGALAAAQRYVSGVLGALGDLSRVDVSACLGCSAGVACYPQHGEEATELIARADTALYRVKAQGGSAVLLAAEVEATDEDSGSFQALVG
jgi:diguanylate cyclase (GGDEF)-like protein